MPRSTRLVSLAVTTLAALAIAGCFDEPPVERGVVVFDDAFSTGFSPNPFQYSLETALSIDSHRAHAGSASIRLEVPGPPGYTGGAVLADTAQDLSRTTALSFWVMGSRKATFDQVGFGLEFDPDPSTYWSAVYDLPVTPTWTHHLVPIADPAKLTAEKGMLYYVDTTASAYTAWFDEVKFDVVPTAALALQPALAGATTDLLVGGTAPVAGLTLHYKDADGTVRALDGRSKGSGPARAFFRFTSSDPSVATVDATGKVAAVGLGQAAITATLAGRPVPGTFTVNVLDTLPTAPTAAPPAPTAPASEVISLFSSAYPDVAVDSYAASWSAATFEQVTIAGEPMLEYTKLDFVGIEFTGANLVDASGMDYLHLDVWTPDATTFRVKLVDFGADGKVGGGDDSEQELTFTGASTPALTQGGWVGLDIPMTAFLGLTSRSHLAQLIFSALPTAKSTVFVDNVYFHR